MKHETKTNSKHFEENFDLLNIGKKNRRAQYTSFIAVAGDIKSYKSLEPHMTEIYFEYQHCSPVTLSRIPI